MMVGNLQSQRDCNKSPWHVQAPLLLPRTQGTEGWPQSSVVLTSSALHPWYGQFQTILHLKIIANFVQMLVRGTLGGGANWRRVSWIWISKNSAKLKIKLLKLPHLPLAPLACLIWPPLALRARQQGGDGGQRCLVSLNFFTDESNIDEVLQPGLHFDRI